MDHGIVQTDSGVVVMVIAMPSELAFLESVGFERLATVSNPEMWAETMAECSAALAAPADQPGLLAEAGDTVQVLRADYWKSDLSEALSIEAKTSAGTGASMTAYWEPAPLFGITCKEAAGMGTVPEKAVF